MTVLAATTGGNAATPPSVAGLGYTVFESNPNGSIETIAAADDADFAAGGSGNPGGTTVMVAAWALDDMPSDPLFGTMDDLSFRVRYQRNGADADITMQDIKARLVNGSTLLAGGSNVAVTNAASFQTFVSGAFSSSWGNSTLTAFSYVDTAANKTTWDGAILEINYTRVRAKGGGTDTCEFSAAEVSGNYTEGSGGALVSKLAGESGLAGGGGMAGYGGGLAG